MPIPTIRERAGWSRKQVKLVDGLLPAGTVLGKLAVGGFAEWNPGADDGTENAAAVLLVKADARVGGAEVVAVVRMAEVDVSLLKFNPNGSPTEDEIDQAKADLAAVGITMSSPNFN